MTNEYGLDVSYFQRTNARELNDKSIRCQTPSDLARVYARLSRTADDSVMLEDEFAGKVIKAQAQEIDMLRLQKKARDNDLSRQAQEIARLSGLVKMDTDEVDGLTQESERLREAICIYVREESPTYANHMWELDIDNKDEYAINLFVKHNQE